MSIRALRRSGYWLALAGTFAGACQQPISASIAPAASLNLVIGDSAKKSASLSLNDTLRIKATVFDIFQRPIGGRVTYVSRNGLVASVSTGGLIKGLANGTTYIVGSVVGGNNSVVSDSVKVQVTVVCTLEARPGIVIALQDSLTGSTGPFASVSYVAREGATYRDSTFLGTVPAQIGGVGFAAGLAYERPGTYQVTVTANSYRAWGKAGVMVARDLCHVQTVNLTARLVRQ